MSKKNPKELDFEVDKLTNSIESVLSGEVFETEIVRIHRKDSNPIEPRGWLFDWDLELREPNHEVYALMTREDPSIIHGLISLEDRHDHMYIDLIESASFNRGKSKLFRGVAGNLVAFACKTSFEKGFRGYTGFIAKSLLIEHYEISLGAKRLYGNHMFFDTGSALHLIHSYFKDFDDTRL